MKKTLKSFIGACALLLAGAASAASSSGIVEKLYVAPAAGAVARTYADKLADVVSVKDYGADPAGVKDSTPAIQKAIDYAATAGKVVYVPAGTYKVTPATAATWEGGTLLAGLLMRSNMHIVGDAGAVLRIADGVSSDAAPKEMAMFFTNGQLHDVSFEGFTLDMNAAGNPISPNRPTTYNLLDQAHIMVSGTVGGTAARIDGAFIDRMQFINTPGVSCIIMAQSNVNGVQLGKRWTVRNSRFYNNGTDSNDHSSIFGWADDVIIDGNTFENDTPQGTIGRTGGIAAYEVHGANQRFVNNKVRNYFRGMWVATNQTSDVSNIVISGNTFSPVRFYGVDFFRESATASEVSKVVITGNTFGLDDNTIVGDPTQKVAVQIAASYKIHDVLVASNIAEKVGTGVSSAFFVLTPQNVAGQTHDNITVSGNHAYNFTSGAYIRTSTGNGLGNVTVQNNQFFDMTDAGGSLSSGVSLLFTTNQNMTKSVTIEGNQIIDTRATPQTKYGLYLSGTVDTLYVGKQTYIGMVTADYYEDTLTVTKRKGQFDNMQFSPTWYAGSAVTLGNGSAQGIYSIDGEKVMLNAQLSIGSTTVLPGGTLLLDLPIQSGGSSRRYLGSWRITHAGAFTFGTAEIDGTATQVTLQVSGGTLANSGTPVALASGDEIALQITYSR